LVERPPETVEEWARLVGEEADRLDAIEDAHEHLLEDAITVPSRPRDGEPIDSADV
jgi:hypothetical protein